MTGTNCLGSRALSTRAIQRSSFVSVGVLPEGLTGIVVEAVIRTMLLVALLIDWIGLMIGYGVDS